MIRGHIFYEVSSANFEIKSMGYCVFDLYNTRMHSSRMRTVRCSSCLLGGGGVCPEGVPLSTNGVCLPRVSAQGAEVGGVCPGGVSERGKGYLPRGCLPEPPPPLVNRITDACENMKLLQLRCGR